MEATDEKIIVQMGIDNKDRTPCECWTRVMGYFRPVSHFNVGKKSEYKDRKWFTEDKINIHVK